MNAKRPKPSRGPKGPSVAKEDVNVSNPGKKPRETSAAKPKKKAGKRLMDYTG